MNQIRHRALNASNNNNKDRCSLVVNDTAALRYLSAVLLCCTAPPGLAPSPSAAVAVAVLSLGEVSAGKLVSTPGMPSFAETVWVQMHYGVTNNLAASCLLLLATVGAGGARAALWPFKKR